MNDDVEKSLDSYRSFQLLSEIAGEEPLSQRELSRRLGIAVGLVNSYLKNLVAKGYVRVKNFPRNRYAYLLTPTGLAEKSRLAYQHLSYFTNLYTVARQDYLTLFQSLKSEGVTQVVFCGVDEVAEIAYLSLQEVGLELVAVLDEDAAGERFFGMPVAALAQGVESVSDVIVISSLKRKEHLRGLLERAGVQKRSIRVAGEGVQN
ncbi:winged helix-turn-helix transcriptional regulator [Geobacter benzoatilyticus]|uniref:Winged helix-turn-helix transcriptional regulator n=1 Tax=Geobacter benzoatilyticus TaxID=2815309 RepID=A0ABX7Q5F9_9BACT|nr:winged helix-turn-helix transcriptional regulator [Geobacter benzoatilyticus]QSV46143.1 winged helix-turn-helix transcriptional regulator [Geobacter benzoatilyticus]